MKSKFVFYKRMMGDRKQKKFAYLIMMVSALAFAVLFLLFAVLKVGDIDIHKENNYRKRWWGSAGVILY